MLTLERKTEIIAQHQRGETDTGSPEVQIAILTEKISYLTEHFGGAAGSGGACHRPEAPALRQLV